MCKAIPLLSRAVGILRIIAARDEILSRYL
jgi:hypothetical protein